MPAKTRFNWRTEALAALVLIAFFIGATKVLEYYIGVFQQTLNPKPLLLAAMAIPMFFGALLAAFRLLVHRTRYRLNWVRLLIQGLPALVLAVPVLLWAWPGLDPKYVFWWPLQRSSNVVTVLAGVWFGWALASGIEPRQGDNGTPAQEESPAARGGAATGDTAAQTQETEAGLEGKAGDKIG